MTEFKTEDEQVEDLKRWFKDNGKSMLTTVLVVVVAISGFKYYQNEQYNKAVAASQGFEALLDDLSKNKLNDAVKKGEAIIAQFPDSEYANQASFMMAKMALDSKDNKRAKAHLTHVIDNSKQESLKNLAALRLARILLSEGAVDEANVILGKLSDVGNFKGQYEELMGDIHMAKGDAKKAKEAYDRSLKTSGAGERANIIRMKIDQLSVESEKPAAG